MTPDEKAAIKIRPASDFHLQEGISSEAADQLFVELAGADGHEVVLLLAGDITTARDLPGLLARHAHRFRAIVAVAGNHEFYGVSLAEGDALLAAPTPANVHILNPGQVVIDGVTFVGATLWTNLLAYGPRAVSTVERGVADFSHIRGMTPELFSARHHRDRAFLSAALHAGVSGPRVVVTHHLPSPALVSSRYRHSPLNPAFLAQCDELLATSPEIWVFGHSHDAQHRRLGSTIIACNPYGYLWEVPMRYDSSLTLRVSLS